MVSAHFEEAERLRREMAALRAENASLRETIAGWERWGLSTTESFDVVRSRPQILKGAIIDIGWKVGMKVVAVAPPPAGGVATEQFPDLPSEEPVSMTLAKVTASEVRAAMVDQPDLPAAPVSEPRPASASPLTASAARR